MRRPSMSQIGWLLAALASCGAAPAPGDTLPVPLQTAPPPYPVALQRQLAEGSVRMACTITADGSTQDCAITSSTDHRFDASALSYAQAARYRPATRNGVPVARPRHTMIVNFTLSQHADIRSECMVDHTGRVRHCAVISGGQTPMLPLMGQILSPIHIAPTLQNGTPVDDPHRQIRVVLEESTYPALVAAAPLPRSDLTATFYMACRPAGGDRAARPVCRSVDAAALPALLGQRAPAEQAVVIQQFRAGITGVRPGPLPDASFAGPD